MDLKEINIANSIIEGVLSEAEIASLKHNLISEENFKNFLSKFIEVLIEKDKSITLKDFLEFNNLITKHFLLKNKRDELIESLAELKFKDITSENIEFLTGSNNETFINHLEFLKETSRAIKIEQRAALKKKLEQVDKLNEFDLNEQEIKTAIKLTERARLKTHLAGLHESGRKEAKVISLKFKTILKYAAIIVFIIGPAIFFINRLNHNGKGTQELADNKEIIKRDTSVTKINTPLDTFQLPNPESYSIENEVLQAKNFGYASSLNKKITISVFNISRSLNMANDLCKKAIAENKSGYGPSAKKNCQTYDSLNVLKETYTFNNKTNALLIHSTKWLAEKRFISKLKLLSIEKGTESILYLKVETNYYLIKVIGKNNDLKEEKNEDVLDKLILIENQNQ